MRVQGVESVRCREGSDALHPPWSADRTARGGVQVCRLRGRSSHHFPSKACVNFALFCCSRKATHRSSSVCVRYGTPCRRHLLFSTPKLLYSGLSLDHASIRLVVRLSSCAVRVPLIIDSATVRKGTAPSLAGSALQYQGQLQEEEEEKKSTEYRHFEGWVCFELQVSVSGSHVQACFVVLLTVAHTSLPLQTRHCYNFLEDLAPDVAATRVPFLCIQPRCGYSPEMVFLDENRKTSFEPNARAGWNLADTEASASVKVSDSCERQEKVASLNIAFRSVLRKIRRRKAFCS